MPSFVRKSRDRRGHEIHAFFHEGGWQQWGESREILGDNVCLVERIRDILVEEHMS